MEPFYHKQQLIEKAIRDSACMMENSPAICLRREVDCVVNFIRKWCIAPPKKSFTNLAAKTGYQIYIPITSHIPSWKIHLFIIQLLFFTLKGIY